MFIVTNIEKFSIKFGKINESFLSHPARKSQSRSIPHSVQLSWVGDFWFGWKFEVSLVKGPQELVFLVWKSWIPHGHSAGVSVKETLQHVKCETAQKNNLVFVPGPVLLPIASLNLTHLNVSKLSYCVRTQARIQGNTIGWNKTSLFAAQKVGRNLQSHCRWQKQLRLRKKLERLAYRREQCGSGCVGTWSLYTCHWWVDESLVRLIGGCGEGREESKWKITGGGPVIMTSWVFCCVSTNGKGKSRTSSTTTELNDISKKKKRIWAGRSGPLDFLWRTVREKWILIVEEQSERSMSEWYEGYSAAVSQ